jgi:hypothetical protein
MTMFWRRLFSKPSSNNESTMLELPRAWEPSDGLGSLSDGKG